jgi:hypothetical protein
MRRYGRIVAACLAVGLAATVLVAWGAAATARVPGRTLQSMSRIDGSVRWGISIEQMPAGVRIDSQREGSLAWSPQQATGQPDMPSPGDKQTAWASLGPDDRDEWLELTYAAPVITSAIHVHETDSPGAVSKVTSVDGAGKETIIWQGVDPTPIGQPGGVSVLRLREPARVGRIRIYLDSRRVAGWNEIDAVGLQDAQGKLHWARYASASSTYAKWGRGTASQPNPQAILPSWAAALATPGSAFADGEVKSEERSIEARGWPFVALWRELDSSEETLKLPMQPIWLGVIGDVGVFAAAAGVVWLVCVALRRFVVESVRLRRGLCMRCGYDLQFNLAGGCPECGWRREAASVGTAI